LPRAAACCAAMLLCAGTALPGCAVARMAAIVTGSDPTGPQPAQYKGLASQTVAVFVWADWSVRSDFARVRDHLGSAIQSKIVNEGQIERKSSNLSGTKFPYPAASVVQFQDRHPDLLYKPIEQVVLRLGIDEATAKATGAGQFTRVIHVEVNDLQTRLPQSRSLFRGWADVNLKVVEIADGKAAKIAFEEPHITVRFPPQKSIEALSPDENINDETVYAQTLAMLAHAICRRFYEP
jgi:hypothetical protein